MAIENEKLIIKCGIFNIRSNFLYKDLIINFFYSNNPKLIYLCCDINNYGFLNYYFISI